MQEVAHIMKQQSTNLNNNTSDEKHSQLDPGSALQQFLDRIPLSSISGIQKSVGTTTTTLIFPANFALIVVSERWINLIDLTICFRDSMSFVFLC